MRMPTVRIDKVVSPVYGRLSVDLYSTYYAQSKAGPDLNNRQANPKDLPLMSKQ
jgi:hypothetical protein